VRAVPFLRRRVSDLLANTALRYTSAVVLSRLPPFFYLPVFAARLPLAALGHYLTALILADLVQILCASGMGQALFRFFPLAEDTAARRALVGTAFFTGMASAAAACLVFACAYLWPGARASLEAFRNLPSACFALALLAGTCIGLTSILNSSLWAESRSRAYLIALGSGAALEAILAGVMIGFDAVDLERMLAIECAKDAAVLLLTAWAARRHLSPRFDPGRFRALIRFGAWFTPMGFFGWALLSTDRFWLGQHASMAEVGVFGFFYKFASPATVLFQSYLISLDGKVFRAKAEEASELLRAALRRYLRWAGGLVVAASLGLPAAAYLAIRAGALPAPYLSGLKVYPLLLALVYVYFWALHYSAWQDYHLRSARQMGFMGCAALANFLLSPLAIALGRRFGVDALSAVAYSDLAAMTFFLALHSRGADAPGRRSWLVAAPWVGALLCIHFLWIGIGSRGG
jgi:O-antigen/teichoic acid export membrane protein